VNQSMACIDEVITLKFKKSFHALAHTYTYDICVSNRKSVG